MMKHTLTAVLLGALAAPACDTYDPPPETTLVQSATGLWTKTDPIVVRFTEPIVASSLVVSVWPHEIDSEGNLRPGVHEVVAACTVDTSPCGTFEMALDDARSELTLTVNETFAELEGVPLILEVHEGLRDDRGRVRKVADWFDFQISPAPVFIDDNTTPSCGEPPTELDLETGVVSLTANLQVLPVWLHLYMDLAIDAETGVTTTIASFAKVEQGLPTNYDHPDGFVLPLDVAGWAVTYDGCLTAQPDGTYFFRSEPFDVHILVLSTIPVVLQGFQVQGTIEPGGADDGRTFASGTLSTTGGSFGDPPTEVEPITTAWTGFGFHSAELPDGLPRVCDGEPCAAMDKEGGDCQLDAPWTPRDGVCLAE